MSDIDLSLEESDDEADAIQARSLDRRDSCAAIPDPQTSAVGIEVVTESVSTESQCDSSEDEDDMPLASRIRQQQQTEPAVGGKQTVTPKWKYRDIANVDVMCSSTFTTPTEIGTPLYYFKQFVDDDMINNLKHQTNLYSVEKTGSSLNVTADEIEQFIGIHIMTGIVKVPSYRQYWADSTRIATIADVMPRNRFDKLRSFIHVNDNTKMLQRSEPGYDKLFKVRPFIDSLRKNLSVVEQEEYSAVDEMVTPFKGHISLKQYIKNKPHKWGIKVFARAGATGFCYDFEIYVGKGTVASESGIGISGDVVLRLTEGLPVGENYKVFMDNWFTSYQLIVELKKKGLLSVGTVRQNRIPGCVLKKDDELKKKGRGSYDFRTEHGQNIVAVKWFDNRAVYLISSYAGINPVGSTRRWSLKDKQFITVDQPSIVKEYNKFMGGVDLHDMLVALYRINIRAKRYYLRIIFHLIDMCVINARLLYRRHVALTGETKHMSLMDFRSDVARALLRAGKVINRKRGRPSAETVGLFNERVKRTRTVKPVDDARFDCVGHWPDHSANKYRCALCKDAKSHIRCMKCNVALCLTQNRNHFESYHTK